MQLETLPKQASQYLQTFKKSLQLDEKRNLFVRDRMQLCPDNPDGREILKTLKIPYLEMDIPQFDYKAMFQEALNLESVAVPHRSDDSEGWKSLCIHGLDATKTAACKDYGYLDEHSTPYQWTWVAEKAPKTAAYIRLLQEKEYFTELYRVRFMYLAPGGYIQYHRDRPEGQTSLGPLNIALNMPEECYWYFKDWGRVPFAEGKGIAVDISNLHGVWNHSEENRIHIIVHGRYGDEYYRCLSRSSQKLKQSLADKSETSKHHPPKVSSTTNNKLACLLWEWNPEIEDQELFKVCGQMTEHFARLRANRSVIMEKGSRLGELLEKAIAQEARWAVVLTPGNVLKENIFKEISVMVREADPSTFLFAHIMDRKERWYEVHPQFFIVDVEKWVRLGKPPFNIIKEDHIKLIQPERSVENIHDDNTPLFLKPSNNRTESGAKGWGWNWIDTSLKAGFQIQNLPPHVRAQKEFLYPEQNGRSVYNKLKNMSNIESAQPESFHLSDHQNNVFQFLKREAEGIQSKLFLFNTEMVRNNFVEYDLKKLSAYIGLPAGFKDIHTLFRHKFEKDCELVYFDINPATLSFKSKMFEKWDGFNFPEFVFQMIDEHRDQFGHQQLLTTKEERVSRWKQEVELWGSEKSFQEFFVQLKSLPKKFIEMDITSNANPILGEIKRFRNQHIAIWYSNCFNYTPGIAAHGWDFLDMRNKGLYFLNQVYKIARENNLRITVYGEDPGQGVAFEKFGIEIREVFN